MGKFQEKYGQGKVRAISLAVTMTILLSSGSVFAQCVPPVTIPICAAGEFLTSNGIILSCATPSTGTPVIPVAPPSATCDPPAVFVLGDPTGYVMAAYAAGGVAQSASVVMPGPGTIQIYAQTGACTPQVKGPFTLEVLNSASAVISTQYVDGPNSTFGCTTTHSTNPVVSIPSAGTYTVRIITHSACTDPTRCATILKTSRCY